MPRMGLHCVAVVRGRAQSRMVYSSPCTKWIIRSRKIQRPCSRGARRSGGGADAIDQAADLSAAARWSRASTCHVTTSWEGALSSSIGKLAARPTGIFTSKHRHHHQSATPPAYWVFSWILSATFLAASSPRLSAASIWPTWGHVRLDQRVVDDSRTLIDRNNKIPLDPWCSVANTSPVIINWEAMKGSCKHRRTWVLGW